jgi:hypothetical protein
MELASPAMAAQATPTCAGPNLALTQPTGSAQWKLTLSAAIALWKPTLAAGFPRYKKLDILKQIIEDSLSFKTVLNGNELVKGSGNFCFSVVIV